MKTFRRGSRLRKGRNHKSIRKMYGTSKYKPGYNHRPFTKKRGTKGKQLFTLKKGDLTKYGYHANLSVNDRHKALRKSLSDRNTKPLSIFRKLNALFVLNKNKNPTMAKLYKGDSEWVKTTPEYKGKGGEKRTLDETDTDEYSIYSNYSTDDLEDKYKELVDKQNKEDAQVEELPEVQKELIKKYEDEINYLSSHKRVPLSQMAAYLDDDSNEFRDQLNPRDMNQEKANILIARIEKVKNGTWFY
jgi:hypothetical protein